MTACAYVDFSSAFFTPEFVSIRLSGRTGSFDYLDDSFTSRAFVFAMAVGVYFVPLAAVIACHILILREVRRSEQKFSRKSRDMRNATGGSNDDGSMHKERASRKKETQIAKVIFFVIIGWVTSWTPYLVVSFMGIFFWRDALTPWTSQAPALFAKTGSVYNPVSLTTKKVFVWLRATRFRPNVTYFATQNSKSFASVR
nr:rhabdomeric opsin [Echiniscus testudo]